MAYKIVVWAQDRADGKRKKGDIADVLRPDQDPGSMITLPKFIIVNVTDGANWVQATTFVDQWRIQFLFSIDRDHPLWTRYTVEVDPLVISASDKGKGEIKQEMYNYIENAEPGSLWEGSVVNGFTVNSMTVTIPKPHSREMLKNDFNDKFMSVLEINRYYFKETGVDWAIAQGGEVFVTQVQVMGNLVDKFDE